MVFNIIFLYCSSTKFFILCTTSHVLFENFRVYFEPTLYLSRFMIKLSWIFITRYVVKLHYHVRRHYFPDRTEYSHTRIQKHINSSYFYQRPNKINALYSFYVILFSAFQSWRFTTVCKKAYFGTVRLWYLCQATFQKQMHMRTPDENLFVYLLYYWDIIVQKMWIDFRSHQDHIVISA